MLPVALMAVSCSDEELSEEVVETPVSNELKSIYAYDEYRWNIGEEIPYFIEGGTRRDGYLVEDCMETWMAYANVKFKEAPNFQSAIVRIKIYPDNGSNVNGNSALGKLQQLQVNQKNPNSPTVNLYISGMSHDKAETVILHELGHVLGLVDETYHKDFNVNNLKSNLIKNEIGSNLYDQLFGEKSRNDYQYGVCNNKYTTPFNPNSIMMYEIPSRWTKNGISYPGGVDLTPQDIMVINMMYPFEAKYVPVFVGSEGNNGAILGRFADFGDWTKVRKFVGYGFEQEQPGTYPVTRFVNKNNGEVRMGTGKKSGNTIVWDEKLLSKGFEPVKEKDLKPIYMYYSHGYGRTPVEVYYKNGEQVGYSYCFDSYLTSAGYTRPGSPLALVTNPTERH